MRSDTLPRVLIVDDEAHNVRALSETLHDRGYDAVGVTSGEEALRLMRERPFDVLLTDLVMPGLGGVELLGAAQQADPHVVGILMTGKGTIETAVQAMQAGALDYVLKPLKLGALLPVLARAMVVRTLRLENLELRNTVAIQELNEAIAHTLDTAVLLDKVADAAMAQFGADEVSVMLLTEDRQSLYVAAVRGERRDAMRGAHMPLREGIAGHVATHRKPLVLQDTVSDKVTQVHLPAGVRTAVAMPMIARDTLVGVLNVNFTRQAKPISSGEINVLRIFVNAAAAAIEAARLYEAERKTHEELIQTQKMETLGRLAGGVAHDFNNLLTVILAGCELAVTELAPGSAAVVQLDDIAAAGKRAAALTQQLLAFSRRQIAAPRILDVNAQVRAVESLLRKIAPDVDIAVAVSDLPWRIRMDPSHFDQVILNLAANSRDAMPDGGSLRIATANVTADDAYCAAYAGLEPGDHVVLRVTDTGQGMDAETLKHAFEPFFTTKAEGKGTGIGLASVHGIVEQNQGIITLESELGSGTSVTVHFPRCSDEPAGPRLTPAQGTAVGHETVLLVDDDMKVRQVARRVLERLGYQVLEAADAAAAIQWSSTYEGEIHLLLSDISMPTMDGLTLSDRVKAGRPGIGTLFMSGYAPEQIAQRHFAIDGLRHIQKPFEIGTLSAAVRGALNARTAK